MNWEFRLRIAIEWSENSETCALSIFYSENWKQEEKQVHPLNFWEKGKNSNMKTVFQLHISEVQDNTGPNGNWKSGSQAFEKKKT